MPNCLYCDADLEQELASAPEAPSWAVVYIWVDALSGDDGGTYDYCPVNPTKEHVPAA